MALGREYLELLGLEIAKKKYYNAARVESVIEDFSRRAASLERENITLREQAQKLSSGREEIGEAILSAKVIAQQLIAEAKAQAETILAEAREEAARIVAEAEEQTVRLSAEAEEKTRSLAAAREEREQRTVQAAEESYLHLREKAQEALGLLDGEWQRFLCSIGDTPPEKEELPADLADRLGEIAQSLDEIGADEEKQGV
ncbi:MAG: DivIVA domain-containing protein [Oscillospiraceae bacterium]|nr:DivIVA domain-containing protein [Oscillospiraceae bacterium]